MAPVNSISSVLGTLNDARKSTADLSDKSLQARVNRALCDVFASNATSSLVAGIGGTAVASEVCGDYWAKIGAEPIVEQPPFSGGQCPNVFYEVTATETDINGNTTTSSIVRLRGPITRATQTTVPGETRTGYFVTGFQTTSGFTQVFSEPTFIAPSPAGSFDAVIGGRTDGQPDNCGDPPTEVRPSPNYPNPRPIGIPTDIGDDPDLIEPWTFDLNDDGVIEGSPSIGAGFPDNFPGIVFDPFSVSTGTDLPDDPRPIDEGEPVDTGSEEFQPFGEVSDPQPPISGSPNTDFFCIGYRWELVGFPSREGRIPGTQTVFPRVVGNVQLKIALKPAGFIRGESVRIYASKGVVLVPDKRFICRGLFWQRGIQGRFIFTPLFVSREKPISEV